MATGTLIAMILACLSVGASAGVGMYLNLRKARIDTADGAEQIANTSVAHTERLRLQEQEHEVLSPEFLETQTILFGGLGHTRECLICYPVFRPVAPKRRTEEIWDDIDATLAEPTGSGWQEMCDSICEKSGHKFVLGSYSCITCGRGQIEFH